MDAVGLSYTQHHCCFCISVHLRNHGGWGGGSVGKVPAL